MTLLSLDTTGQPVSAAITRGSELIGEFYLNTDKKHAVTLMPLIDSLLKFTQTKLSDLDGIAVCAGPGSFTGIRIGAACAQGLCYALNLPLYTVNTLDALLMNIRCAKNRCAIMDAKRGEVYAKAVTEDDVTAEGAMPVTELISLLGARPYTFCGDGVPVYGRQISEALPQSVFVNGAIRLQRASVAAECVLAGQAAKSGYDGLTAVYMRDSGAQRKMQKNTPEGNL